MRAMTYMSAMNTMNDCLPNIFDSYDDIYKDTSDLLNIVESDFNKLSALYSKNKDLLDLLDKYCTKYSLNQYNILNNHILGYLKESIDVMSITLYFSSNVNKKYDIIHTNIELKKMKICIQKHHTKYSEYLLNTKIQALEYMCYYFDLIKNDYTFMMEILNRLDGVYVPSVQ